MGKSSGSAPAAPDPQETANAQLKFSKQAALWNSALNNVNQITPYGTLSYSLGNATSQGGPVTYDQAAYDAALQEYNSKQGKTQNMVVGTDQYNNPIYKDVYIAEDGSSSPGGQAPQLSDFKTGGSSYGDLPQWTSNIQLSPEMQKIFDSQMRRQRKPGCKTSCQASHINQGEGAEHTAVLLQVGALDERRCQYQPFIVATRYALWHGLRT